MGGGRTGRHGWKGNFGQDVMYEWRIKKSKVIKYRYKISQKKKNRVNNSKVFLNKVTGCPTGAILGRKDVIHIKHWYLQKIEKEEVWLILDIYLRELKEVSNSLKAFREEAFIHLYSYTNNFPSWMKRHSLCKPTLETRAR